MWKMQEEKAEELKTCVEIGNSHMKEAFCCKYSRPYSSICYYDEYCDFQRPRDSRSRELCFKDSKNNET
jgi:hypothetical protein